MRAALLALLVMSVGCIPRVPQQRLGARARIAVAYVVDPGNSGAATSAPDALKQKVAAELDARNLEVVEVPVASLNGQRLSDARYEALRTASAEAPYLLLVEQRVQFFSQLDGRYRWVVSTSITGGKKVGPGSRDPFELPILLMFEHEKEPEAIVEAAGDVATRAGALLDGVLVGSTAPVAVAAPKAIYFVMVDRFENGDRTNDVNVNPDDPQAFHGGDLRGLTARLPWIAELGFDTVWVSPIFAMRTSPYHGFGAFHGYWTWDLSKLEPAFGTEAELAALRAGLDRRHLSLMMDLVLNHVGPDAPLVTQRPDWFHRLGGITDWNDPEQLVTRDVHGLPDLATERIDVDAYLTTATRRWLRARAA